MFAPQIKNLFSFGRRDEGGYYLTIAGKSWIHFVETEKFILSSHRFGLSEVLHDAPALLARFRGSDKIGIVPNNIIPCYCESWIPGESIADFMNFPCKPPVCDALLPPVSWQPLSPVRLQSVY